ncbi:Lrp/AsnC family transcriptional regulator [methane-oxidizing endosymbiont of Gigantopelta aegis]|uniref:Lrp/AsnC family transcriptional regulator n=1 Tax=methane-oxidizing endosymbiont of Gigantopelta aegis TaxID=2794938 RepID=UPI0018DBD8C6|nr:AsnC family transcriptional regulator [methane-oxidizing endosymbiont of Gigantopelta aegis]
MDKQDKAIINLLQDDFPICDAPYKKVAERLGIGVDELLQRLESLLQTGVLSRFGPMFHAEKMGGGLTLAAMQVPEQRFDEVAEMVNAFPEVAHNYARQHHFNMWFVLATESPEQIQRILEEISEKTGLKVYDMPKKKEYFVGLRLPV